MNDKHRLWTAAVMKLGTRSVDGRIVDSVYMRAPSYEIRHPRLSWMAGWTTGLPEPLVPVAIGLVAALRVDSNGLVWVGGMIDYGMLEQRDPAALAAVMSDPGCPVSAATRRHATDTKGPTLVLRDVSISEVMLSPHQSIPPWEGLPGLSITRNDWHWVAEGW